MAKQNVGFAERHLEKIVVGVAGAVLAAMLFLYVIQDPYVIEVSGETLGPSAFYPALDEQAAQMLGRLKNAGSKEVTEWKPPSPPAQRNATDLPVVFAQLAPPVPGLELGVEQSGQLDLVGILPPGKPVCTAGKGQVTLPSPQVVLFGEQQARAPEPRVTEQSSDVSWAAVFATIPRRAQQEAFIKAKYSPGPVNRQLLIVTQVEAERQRRLPSGDWGPTEKVARAYTPVILSGPKTLQMYTQNGRPFMPPDEYQLFERFKTEALRTQDEILRPPFQPLLPPEMQAEWSVPDSFPDGATFDWTQDYNVAVPAPTLAALDGDKGGRVNYQKAKQEIDALIAAGNYIEAESKILALMENNTALTAKQRTDLQELANQLAPRVDELRQRIEQERNRRLEAQEATLGPDTDLLWVTDLGAEPGETYRYRVRIWALNLHAGQIDKLRNPEDAAKLVLAGEWSEWSDPVRLKPIQYLFCTQIRSEQTIAVEINQWANGQWDKTTNQSIGLGQPVAFQGRLKSFKYDAVAVLVDQGVPYEERSLVRNTIQYRNPQPTDAVLFVRSDGEVEEHLVAEDVKRRREMASEFAPPREGAGREMITPTGGGGGRIPGGRLDRYGPPRGVRPGGRFTEDDR